MVSEPLKDQGASRKILQRPLHLDSCLPDDLHLCCEQVEHKVLVVPSLVRPGLGVVPFSALKQGETVLRIGGGAGRWQKPEDFQEKTGLQIALEKPGGGTSLKLAHGMKPERNVGCHLHMLAEVPKTDECQKLVVLEPVWVLSSASNPISQLVCQKAVQAFKVELAVVGLIPTPEGRYLATVHEWLNDVWFGGLMVLSGFEKVLGQQFQTFLFSSILRGGWLIDQYFSHRG